MLTLISNLVYGVRCYVNCRLLPALYADEKSKRDYLKMEPNNIVDNGNGLGYNTNNDVYDAVAEHYLNQPILVKMDEQNVLNDNSCQHEELIPNPKDTIGDAVYHGCANKKCGVGFYIRPNEDKN